MIRSIPPFDPAAPVLIVSIGNTTTSVGTWHETEVKTPLSVPTADQRAMAEAFDAHCEAAPGGRPAATVIASVVPAVLTRIAELAEQRLQKGALIVGETVPMPLDLGVTEPETLGTDRVCQAAAAYERLQAGCTVVSFGTAVTVDLVDDDGTFLGGAIFPGIHVQLRSLHEHTAQLPLADPAFHDLPYGRNTIEAIQTGVCRGVCAAVRGIVEGYATHLHRWPQVIATGGDAALVQPYCDFIDNFVAHLALRGVGVAFDKYLAERGA